MATLSEFFTFLPQCCDADNYLRIGQACAAGSDCYDDLRPMGAVYWFSLPFRAGLSPDVVIIGLHLVLATISVVLSVFALRKFFQLHNLPAGRQILLHSTFIIFSVISHAIFLNPTLQSPLSDTPASLFALIALWLLILNPITTRARTLTWLLAGLCLGLAAWIRVFFLYPVLFILATWFVIWLRNKNRQGSELVLLFALLPIIMQFYATWKHSKAISYVDPQITHNLLIEHRDNKSIGYDMVLDSRGIWNWYSDCPDYKPLISALQSYDLHSLNCLISGRLNFYLGSYAPHNFVNLGGYEKLWGANLLLDWDNNKNNANTWHSINIQRDENSIVAPDKTVSADSLYAINPKQVAEIYQTLELQSSSNPYVFSTWLWGNDNSNNNDIGNNSNNNSVNMMIRDHNTGEVVAQRAVQLMTGKEVKFMNALIDKSGLYDAVIQLPVTDTKVTFYLWENLDLRLPEPNIENAKASKIRLWSTWLLLANSVAFIVATLLFIYKIVNKAEPSFLLAFIFLILVCGQAILSLPEQRFVIMPMITAWALFLSSMAFLLQEKMTTRRKHS